MLGFPLSAARSLTDVDSDTPPVLGRLQGGHKQKRESFIYTEFSLMFFVAHVKMNLTEASREA